MPISTVGPSPANRWSHWCRSTTTTCGPRKPSIGSAPAIRAVRWWPSPAPSTCSSATQRPCWTPSWTWSGRAWGRCRAPGTVRAQPPRSPWWAAEMAGPDHGSAGPVLVLLHAFPLDARMFDRVRGMLPGIDLRTPDLPGFGDSAVPSAGPDLVAYAAAVIDLLDAAG